MTARVIIYWLFTIYYRGDSKKIGSYIFQGLSPLLNVRMNFKSQENDPINGNDFVHKCSNKKIIKGIERFHVSLRLLILYW